MEPAGWEAELARPWPGFDDGGWDIRHHSVQTGYLAHHVSYPMGTGGRAIERLTFTLSRGVEYEESSSHISYAW
jgi:hypothetical protein